LQPVTAPLPLASVPLVHYFGLLRSSASWAKVARELLVALIRAGHPVSATEIVEDRYERGFQLTQELQDIMKAPQGDGLGLTFCSPTDYRRFPDGAIQVGLLVFEGTRWPPHWVRLALEYLDLALVPSRFCLRSLVTSGFPAERVAVLPHGIDPEIYRPAGRRTPGALSTLNLLFVGTPARRKGLDVLLRALESAFAPSDPVVLRVKTPLYPDEESRPYLDAGWRERIRRLQGQGYRIEVLTDLLTEAEMAELYRHADLLCQPFRAEGFGMPLLEAMACGTPVLATAWSGPLDFIDDTVGSLVREIRLIPGGSMLLDYPPGAPPSKIAEPEVAAVARALRRAAKHRRRLAVWGEEAALRARGWSWAEAARTLSGHLSEVQAGRDRSPHPRGGS
jgi:glycosyltransferase involved in cell wall biosynthesis